MTTANVEDGDAQADDRRAAAFELADGGLVVYDPGRHTAWIETDAPVDVSRNC